MWEEHIDISGSCCSAHITPAALSCGLPPMCCQQGFQYEDVNISQPLTEAIWEATAKRYDVLVVNFFAPWCPWCAEGAGWAAGGVAAGGWRVAMLEAAIRLA